MYRIIVVSEKPLGEKYEIPTVQGLGWIPKMVSLELKSIEQFMIWGVAPFYEPPYCHIGTLDLNPTWGLTGLFNMQPANWDTGESQGGKEPARPCPYEIPPSVVGPKMNRSDAIHQAFVWG